MVQCLTRWRPSGILLWIAALLLLWVALVTLLLLRVSTCTKSQEHVDGRNAVVRCSGSKLSQEH
jgi:uncharacterized membrane protein YeiB